ESGLIVPIGSWILEEAVRHWAGWRSRHPGVVPPVLHVNLSPRQLHQQEFLGFVHHVLGRYGVEPSNVCVELTETVLMDDLERLRELGCDHAQGYLFSKPRPAQDLDTLLATVYPLTGPAPVREATIRSAARSPEQRLAWVVEAER